MVGGKGVQTEPTWAVPQVITGVVKRKVGF